MSYKIFMAVKINELRDFQSTEH